ncbi:MAG: sigma-54-dependent Fis family transcriptional regulator [Candidatus Omnitrophica bacterium]|nr:sigma-54-dependent Fis family transcriptional regulator [Candidatus Omnitrophota bacterium]
MSFGSTVLVVDDEKNAREGLKHFLNGIGYEVLLAASGKEALAVIKKEEPEIVLCDLKMPEMDGLEVLHEMRRMRSEAVMIILTAYGTVENAVQAMKAGAYYYLTKPINFEELELILKKVGRQQALENENISLREELIRERHEAGKIIGESPPIKKLISLCQQVAQSDSSVLIQGESGTGKELFAHLIHSESPRASEPFVTVHIAALTETLLASELFGHERGAFTGAAERKIGRFERANGGSLFLDEISDIPETMQTKLLRVLQSGEFERVGSAKTIRTDVRLICATNKNLKEEARAGRFREDLYYRINVILLDIPPLRERAGDIPSLVQHYLKYFAERNRKRIEKITPEALSLLSGYQWPGNIRELKNIVERMVVLAHGSVITIDQVPEDIRAGEGLSQTELTKGGKFPGTLEEMEENMIRKALSEVNHNKSLAAKKLGISRRTLYRKISEYKIGD